MTRRRYILFLLTILALCARAETIVLHTGARVKGTIVFQNEEVVIVRDVSGARFQYPRADIKEIVAEETQTAQTEEAQIETTTTTTKKASILLELGGGPAFIPGDSVGGACSADLLVGSHHIGDRHLFVGAGVGYHGLFLGTEKYNFLPIQVAVHMPLTEDKHAPMFGVAVGYGIALSKRYTGGIYADLDFGYRCQLNPKTAIALVLFGQFQQAQITLTEIVAGEPFVHTIGRYLVTTGLKMGLFF